MDMVNNIDYIYAQMWGQFTNPLQNMIKYLEKFTVKHREKDVIWIPNNLKTVYTGI